MNTAKLAPLATNVLAQVAALRSTAAEKNRRFGLALGARLPGAVQSLGNLFAYSFWVLSAALLVVLGAVIATFEAPRNGALDSIVVATAVLFLLSIGGMVLCSKLLKGIEGLNR